MFNLLLVVAIAMGLSFMCSLLESVLLSVTPTYVTLLTEQNPKIGKQLAKFRASIDEPIAAILLLNTTSNTAGAALSGALALELFGSKWMAAFSAALTLGILIFSEILPKTIGSTFWKTIAPTATIIISFLLFVLKPILIPLAWINRAIAPKNRKKQLASRAELKALADIGYKEGSLEGSEWQAVTNIINLRGSSLSDVMTPRTKMVAVALEDGVVGAKEAILSSGHSRLPVYDESIDDIEGIVLSRDVWRAYDAGETDLRKIMREARFVPWSKPIDVLIRELQQEQVSMVIVVDEFGGTAGVATMEDLIEEIVGEIQDEHETPAVQFEKIRDNQIKIEGVMPLDDAQELLNIKLPLDSYDTVGGFVFGELGRVPVVGDEVEVTNGRFVVTEMDELRVATVRFQYLEQPSDSDTHGNL